MKFYFLAIALLFGAVMNAQVKIGNNPTTINGGSLLELESTNKGLLLTRVALTKTTVWGLSGTAVNGMTVYNTSKTMTGTAKFPLHRDTVGIYYWGGNRWVAAGPAKVPDQVVNVSGLSCPLASPNAFTGGTFDGTAADENTIYINECDGSSWTYDASTGKYETYTTTSGTEWWLKDTKVDAAGDKSNFIRRAGSVVIGGNSWTSANQRSLVVGNADTTTGSGGITYGTFTKNTANFSLVGGGNSFNSGAQSIVAGNLDTNTVNFSAVFGGSNYNSGTASIMAGTGSRNTGNYSVVMGFNNSNAGGNNVILAQNDTILAGGYNFAVGRSSVNSSGNYNGLIGFSHITSGGSGNMLFGYGNINGGSFNTIGGFQNSIPNAADYNAIFGFRSAITSTGNNNMVMGNQDTVSGTGTTNLVSGYGNKVSGSSNVVGGYEHLVTSNYNGVFGIWDTVSAQYNLVAGQKNAVSGSSNLVVGQANLVQGGFNMVGGSSNFTSSTAGYNIIAGTGNKATVGDHNIMSGVSNVSLGNYSIFAGLRDTAKHASIVQGMDNYAEYGTAIGTGNRVTTVNSNQHSLAMGYYNTVELGSYNSSTFGRNNLIANNSYVSFVGGMFDTLSNVNYSGIFGYDNLAIDATSILMSGYDNTVNKNNYSLVTGFRNTTSGDQNVNTISQLGLNRGNNSLIMGYSVINNAQGALVIGTNNDTLVGASYNSVVLNDPAFIIGNGASAASRRNAINILKSGWTLINATNTTGYLAPRAELDIRGTGAVIVPVGTTAQRPSAPEFGMIRYNSTLGRGEMYVNDLNGDGTQGDAGWRVF